MAYDLTSLVTLGQIKILAERLSSMLNNAGETAGTTISTGASYYLGSGYIDSVSGENLMSGTTHKLKTVSDGASQIMPVNIGYYTSGTTPAPILANNWLVDFPYNGLYNYSAAVEVLSVTPSTDSTTPTEITFKITGFRFDINCSTLTKFSNTFKVSALPGYMTAGITDVVPGVNIAGRNISEFDGLNAGDKMVINGSNGQPGSSGSARILGVTADNNSDGSDSNLGTDNDDVTNNFLVSVNVLGQNNTDINLGFMNVNKATGELTASIITMRTGNNASAAAFTTTSPGAGNITAEDEAAGFNINGNAGEIAIIRA
ncbi:MAG: hypothetical protein IJ520_09650 [Synergistaceae bacterium]|nr:hypothetical protein [Synergistaceae bacterium]